jgi:16S rRNA (uracil1498-N3)-methyltransferase
MWRGGKSIERWQRVAVASAKQCRRAVVPEIASITPFAAVVASGGTRLLCVEPSAERARPIGAMGPAPTHATVLIGPEGGWSQAEIAAAEEAGCRLIRLGPRTLRAESGPIVALSALWTCWGW